MVHIPRNVKELFNKQALVAFGTANKTGNPNVVPVFWKTIYSDDVVLLIDNFMRQTKHNISENKQVCVSVWDPETEEAYKLKGVATHHTEDEIYDAGKEFIQIKKPDRVPKGVVEIKITEVYDIKPGPEAGNKIA
jgi:predicted pyridoxine 5'-phosphate oxidase superfamily flavin-nucleotide-binding protein